MHWLYRTSRNFVVRLMSLRCHSEVILKKVPTSTVLLLKTFEIERYARKRIKYECSVQIENSVPRDHCSASLGKASRCQTVTLRTEFSICTSHPCKILIICFCFSICFLKHSVSFKSIKKYLQ